MSPAEGVLENDTDVEGLALTAKLVSAPANGTLALSADGSFRFVPRPDFHGGDSFTYRANDGELDSSPATVTITTNPPVAANDAYQIDEDGTLAVSPAGGVLANDTDVEGAALTATLVSAPAKGTLALSADGSFSYVPGPDFPWRRLVHLQGERRRARFEPGNGQYHRRGGERHSSGGERRLPGRRGRDAGGVAGRRSVENDADVEGLALTAKLVSAPANGTLALSADGSFTYVPGLVSTAATRSPTGRTTETRFEPGNSQHHRGRGPAAAAGEAALSADSCQERDRVGDRQRCTRHRLWSRLRRGVRAPARS